MTTETANAETGSAPARPGTIRVLLGCAGWPSGILDVGSWARRRGLAEVVIYQVQPGRVIQLEPEDREAQRCMAAIRRFALGRGDKPGGSGLLASDVGLSDAAREALAAVGGQFASKLIDFDPHVVGFRLEGGDRDEIAGFVRAVRLFCDAEVVLGGPSATSHPREVLDDLGADYVFAGEAEETFARFLELARQHNSKDRQPEIPGLAYRYGGRTWHNTLPADGYGRTVLEASSRHTPRAVRGRAESSGSEGTSGMVGEEVRLADGTRRVLATLADGSRRALATLADGTRSVPATGRCLRNLVRPVTEADVLEANRLDWSLLEGFAREFDSLFFTGGRGCPGACTFCAKLHGQEVRAKSARQLLEEIEAADARVADGAIRVARYRLFEHTDAPELRPLEVAWAAIYDEDFFLHRRRALEFLELWDRSPLRTRYRLGFQTNPCTLLGSSGEVHGELLRWIDRLKPMIQVGAESFHQELLARWHKRHRVEQLHAVLDALDATGQDYAVFILLTDFDTTPEELVETLRLLVLSALPRRRMRIASSPFTIPLFDSQTRVLLEHRGMLTAERIRHFSDYERPQPGWMDPLAAELADLADSELRFALDPRLRDAALVEAFEVVLRRIEEERARAEGAAACSQRRRARELCDQARRAMEQIREARFQGVEPSGRR